VDAAVEPFIRPGRIAIHPPLFYQDELPRRLISQVVPSLARSHP